MSPDALNNLLSLLIGFALAGALASGYQALARRPAGFGLLQQGAAPSSLAAVTSNRYAPGARLVKYASRRVPASCHVVSSPMKR